MATTNNSKLIQPVGYTEMYEWVRTPKVKFGKFVQFSKKYHDKIELCHDSGAVLAGVSTICSTVESDNPDHWKYAYLVNEVGDVFMKEEVLAVGTKVYDQHNEFSYIMTHPWRHYICTPSEEYDGKRKYVPRTSRQEWVRVALLGKTIVYDDGTCKPGEFCQPYAGEDMQKAGNAVPWDGQSDAKFYVLDRVSDKTVTIIINNINMRVQ